MIPRLIGISGKKQHGKNTVAKMIDKSVQEYEEEYYDTVAFADILKAVAGQLTRAHSSVFDTDQKEKESPISRPDGGYYTFREVLQKVGTEFGREVLGPDVWVDALFAGWNPSDQWLITDVRFPNEVKAIEERGGIVIRVIRTGMQNDDTHESETALDNHDFKYNIINCGDLKQLEENVESLLNWLEMSDKPCTAIYGNTYRTDDPDAPTII